MKKPLSAAVLLASSTSTIATTAQFTTQPPSSGILQFCPISAPCTISLHSSLLNITSTSDTTLTTTLPLSYLQTPSLLSSLSSKLLTYQDAYINILITSLPPPPPQTTEIRIPARANEEAGVGSGGYTTIGCCGVFMVYHIGLFYAEEGEVGVCQHATRRYMFPFSKENVWDGVVTAVPVGSSNNVEELLGREKGKCRVVTETRSDLEPPWSRPLTKTVVAEFFTGGERLRGGEVTVSSVDRGRKSVPTTGVIVPGGFMEGGGVVVVGEEAGNEDAETINNGGNDGNGGSEGRGSSPKGSNGEDTKGRKHNGSSLESRGSDDTDGERGTSSDDNKSNHEEDSSPPSGNSGSSDSDGQVAQNNSPAHRPSPAMSLPSETSTADGSNSKTNSQRENFDTQEKGSANSRNKSNNRQESPSKSGYNDAAASSTDGAKKNSADRMVLVDNMMYIWSLVVLGTGAAIGVL